MSISRMGRLMSYYLYYVNIIHRIWLMSYYPNVNIIHDIYIYIYIMCHITHTIGHLIQYYSHKRLIYTVKNKRLHFTFIHQWCIAK